jgi:SAM-dependent methyltransferase
MLFIALWHPGIILDISRPQRCKGISRTWSWDPGGCPWKVGAAGAVSTSGISGTRSCWSRAPAPAGMSSAGPSSVSFLESNSVDLIASDAVYEHCRDLPAVMQESWRILKPGGFIYASYGPLYFCAGGDHFSGRGGLETCFNHLRLDPKAYRDYLEAYQEEIEDFQGGKRYIELNLFSYLTTSRYIEIYQEAHFAVKELILEISHEALRYQKLFPDKFESIVNKQKGRCCQDDLLIKANFIILQKSDN